LIKLLTYILFEKYIYILALEMASTWNQHGASCVGTLQMKWGGVFCKKTWKMGAVFCLKNWTFLNAGCTIYFTFYLLGEMGCVRTQRTPACLRTRAACTTNPQHLDVLKATDINKSATRPQEIGSKSSK